MSKKQSSSHIYQISIEHIRICKCSFAILVKILMVIGTMNKDLKGLFTIKGTVGFVQNQAPFVKTKDFWLLSLSGYLN
jgi:hypothetical protein